MLQSEICLCSFFVCRGYWQVLTFHYQYRKVEGKVPGESDNFLSLLFISVHYILHPVKKTIIFQFSVLNCTKPKWWFKPFYNLTFKYCRNSFTQKKLFSFQNHIENWKRMIFQQLCLLWILWCIKVLTFLRVYVWTVWNFLTFIVNRWRPGIPDI